MGSALGGGVYKHRTTSYLLQQLRSVPTSGCLLVLSQPFLAFICQLPTQLLNLISSRLQREEKMMVSGYDTYGTRQHRVACSIE
jgi:hypothetical protein